VDQIVAAGLQVDAFARRIGADQDAQRLGRRVGVERELDGFAAVGSGGSGQANAPSQRPWFKDSGIDVGGALAGGASAPIR
jgi:hypothetical protein